MAKKVKKLLRRKPFVPGSAARGRNSPYQPGAREVRQPRSGQDGRPLHQVLRLAEKLSEIDSEMVALVATQHFAHAKTQMLSTIAELEGYLAEIAGDLRERRYQPVGPVRG